MKQITKIVFTFENCEQMAISAENIVKIKIDKINDVCSGFYVCLSGSANTEYIPFRGLYQFKTTVFNRLQASPDITSCEIEYSDGSIMDIEVPWDDAEQSKNKFQRNYLTRDGAIHLYIRDESDNDTRGEKTMIKTTTTTTFVNDETGEETIIYVIETTEPDDAGCETECDRGCDNCEDMECTDRGESNDDGMRNGDDELCDCNPRGIEIEIDISNIVRKTLSMVTLVFSAATAIRAWHTIRARS